MTPQHPCQLPWGGSSKQHCFCKNPDPTALHLKCVSKYPNQLTIRRLTTTATELNKRYKHPQSQANIQLLNGDALYRRGVFTQASYKEHGILRNWCCLRPLRRYQIFWEANRDEVILAQRRSVVSIFLF